MDYYLNHFGIKDKLNANVAVPLITGIKCVKNFLEFQK
jgi:hypothetical protein